MKRINPDLPMIPRTLSSLLLGLLLFQAASLYGQGVANQAAQYVNELTGDFQYPVSLLTIPGPNGESIPVSLTYAGGISVEQEASWVGLGWNLGFGEITRSVNGVPDDYNGEVVRTLNFTQGSGGTTQNTHEVTYYGPLYFHNYVGSETDALFESMDIYQSKTDIPSGGSSFTFADYDDFYVSGPGISGTMQLHLFQYANLMSDILDEDLTDNISWRYIPLLNYSGSHQVQNNNAVSRARAFKDWTNPTHAAYRPQFHMHGQDFTTVNAPWFSNLNNSRMTATAPWQQQKTPDDIATAPLDYTGDLVSGSREIRGKYHIDYFTNAELLTSPPTGFQEADAHGFDRSALGASRNDDIGAIRIYTPNGMVYHYSLPVYSYTDSVKIFPLDEGYRLNATNTMNGAEMHVKSEPYVVSWKLTAITGLNYADDGDGEVDEGDRGYWVKYYYRKWADFDLQSPYYGYHLDLSTNAANNEKRSWYNREYDLYEEQGNTYASRTDLYYPEYIQTATHTAYFFKGLRRDGLSRWQTVSGGPRAIPQLRLEKIVLLKNEAIQAAGLGYTQLTASSVLTGLPPLDVSPASVSRNTLNINQYQSFQSDLEANALRVIEFDYDYSLAPGVYNHADNLPSASSSITRWTSLVVGKRYHWLDDYDPSSISGSHGKLTLKEVHLFDYQKFRGTPSYQFTYNSQNPRYNHLKSTHFGYFNQQMASNEGYSGNSVSTTSIVPGGFSPNGQDAWSLTKVVTPTGGELLVNYEPDRIHQTQYTLFGNGSPKAVSEYYVLEYVTHDANSITVRPVDGNIASVLNAGTGIRKIDLYLPCRCQRIPSGGGSPIWNQSAVSRISFSLNDLSITVGTNTLKIENLTLPFQPDCDYTASADAGYDFANYMGTPGYGEGYLKVVYDELTGGGVRVASLRLKEPHTVPAQEYTLEYSYEDAMAPTVPTRFMTSNDARYPLIQSTFGGDRHAPPITVGYGKVTRSTKGQGGLTSGKTVRYFNNRESTGHISYESILHPGMLYEIVRATRMFNTYGVPIREEEYDDEDHLIASAEYEYSSIATSRIQEAAYAEMYNFATLGLASAFGIRSVFVKNWVTPRLVAVNTMQDGITQRITYSNFDKLTAAPTVTRYTGESNVEVLKEVQFSNDHYSTGDFRIGRPEQESTHHDQVLVAGTDYLYTSSIPTFCRSGGQWSRCSVTLNDRSRLLRTEVFDGRRNFDALSTPEALTNYAPAGETTLYNTLERPLEDYDARNDAFAARKYGYEERHVICATQNANYFSATFTSFESFLHREDYAAGGTLSANTFLDGGIELRSGALRVSSAAQEPIRSGQYSLRVQPGITTGTTARYEVQQVDPIPAPGSPFASPQRGLIPGRTYIVTVWARASNPAGSGLRVSLTDASSSAVFTPVTVDENQATQSTQGWTRLSYTFDVPTSYQSGSAGSLRIEFINPGTEPAYFDDFLLRPVDAEVAGAVYDEERDLLIETIDTDNFKTLYEYDHANRIIAVFRETEQGIKEVSRKRYGFIR